MGAPEWCLLRTNKNGVLFAAPHPPLWQAAAPIRRCLRQNLVAARLLQHGQVEDIFALLSIDTMDAWLALPLLF